MSGGRVLASTELVLTPRQSRQQVEKHGLDTTTTRDRTTTFSFLGLTNLVTKESFTGTDADSENKTYTYDAFPPPGTPWLLIHLGKD